MKSAVIVLALATLCSGAALKSRTTALEKDLSESVKERPVAKVVRMLKDMEAQLQAEGEDDKDVYEKITCWCETGTKEKTQAIEEGNAKIDNLAATIEEYEGKISELKELLKNTKDEKNADFEGLNKASANRMKENGEFHTTETELLGAIQSAKQAIITLSKEHPELAQLRKVAVKLGDLPEKFVAESSLSGDQVVAFKGFLQQATKATTAASFLAILKPQSYAPASGAIFGILKQMKEDFEKDLKELQGNEAKAVEEFTGLKAAKEGEMDAGHKQVEQADVDVASFTEKLAQANEEKDDTEEQVKTDGIFLANLQKKCASVDKEYEERVKSRMEELQGVADTIGFLNSDEAHAMFDKTTTSFAQISSVSVEQVEDKMKRSKVIKVLESLADRTQSPRMALLVISARSGDGIAKVIVEIDKMIKELKTQQADEVTERDWCIKELNQNNRSLEAKYDEQSNLLAKQDDLTSTIDQLTKDIKTKTTEIADMQTEMKRDSENREAANAEYQQIVMDQQITQQILAKALDRMKAVYAFLQKGAPHIQTSATDTDPGNGPAAFAKGGGSKNSGGAKVITMIEEVIAESKKSEAEAIAAEQDGQTAYENFMKDSNKSILEYTKMITNMSSDLAKAKEELVVTKESLGANGQELADLHGTEATLHKTCDFLLKNFETRQTARQDEIDGLNEAKGILSGAR